MKRTVVITGGNRGIGKSIAECFLDVGYEVIIAARTRINGEEVTLKKITLL